MSATLQGINKNMTQEKALEILKSDRNVFLTGIAGAGKTFVLMQYIKHLQESGQEFAVTASTGIVAAAINGVTIHSFSGLGIRTGLNKDDILRLKRSKRIAPPVKAIKVLILDEISMFSAMQLDLVDAIFRNIRNDQRPFGGVKVVFCGDFLQLPPVRGEFAFRAKSWEDANLAICYLDKAYRQKDSDLLLLLNAIRNNAVSEEFRNLLNASIGRQIKDFIILYTHNVDVDIYNMAELAKIKGDPYFYFMWTSGDRNLAETIKRNCLSPEKLELKVGAKVMVTKNNFDEGLVNGTMGTVIKLNDSSVKIKTLDGREITIGVAKWSTLSSFGKPIASIHQIPLRLAYAITVHKSQGMTLDSAMMNLSKVFSPGQGYVALSRLRSLDNLSLQESVNDTTFEISPECFEYEKQLLLMSEDL
jgi:ATP-dependent exoDNAse (exonuclease V) alpha subunit